MILMCLGGLAALALGGELLVRGAVGIATCMGLSSMFTGLVIMGSATSIPEMVTSIEAALAGSPGIAWGNIAGSNIANTFLILGATALVSPIILTGVGRRDAVIALLVSVLVLVLAWQQIASVLVGAGLLGLIVFYIVWRYRHPRPSELEEDEDEDADEAGLSLLRQVMFFFFGLGVLIIGGQMLVSGAIDLAQMAGVGETVIGLTVVAVGTSLPELAASITAALRGKSSLAVGNVIGSNIYNLLLIGGVTMAITPIAVPLELTRFALPLIVASAFMMVLLCWFAHRINRWLGALLVSAFAANTILLFA